ncbi:MAG: glycosyltransferase [Armatimonadetes bacterium]|nr:glycosyltransferase [Armatimonadota bacterium]NIM24150.1 glycosyltransferase [Armatimonadota bacterium]NIM68009.1 glycosyltransferase [Armatimonadota bacterium]NIM76504.1 glycosyltransferase [Armatimonadota bacterium]NIN06243.1 glycosyltransferase [Armatimonadota bacterium]
MQISVIIPTKNEAERLPATLEKVLSHLARQNMEWELIVVDNGSQDGTDRMVEEQVSGNPRLKLLREMRPGKGAAIRKGMLAAQGDIVVFSDADLSCPIEEEEKLRDALAKGYDIAIASRRLPESEVDRTPVRRVMSTLFNWVVQVLALPGIKDSQCGFKAFSREKARLLFGAGRIDGFAFDVELLFLARRMGWRIAEVPVRWHQSKGTRVDALSDAARMVRDILKLRWDWIRGKYRGRLGQSG